MIIKKCTVRDIFIWSIVEHQKCVLQWPYLIRTSPQSRSSPGAARQMTRPSEPVAGSACTAASRLWTREFPPAASQQGKGWFCRYPPTQLPVTKEEKSNFKLLLEIPPKKENFTLKLLSTIAIFWELPAPTYVLIFIAILTLHKKLFLMLFKYQNEINDFFSFDR